MKVKEMLKPELTWKVYRVQEKIYLQHKKKQILFDTSIIGLKSKLWRTLCLSSASYSEINLHPSMLRQWLLYLRKPYSCYYLVVQANFPEFKLNLRSMVVGFYRTKYLNTLYTWTKRFIICPTFRQTYIYILRANKLPCLLARLLSIWA